MLTHDEDDRDRPTEDFFDSSLSFVPQPPGGGGGGAATEDVGHGSPLRGGHIVGLAKGDKLGPYELIECVGQGSYGVVWRAWDSKLKRDVAVKFLVGGADSSSKTSRFRQEQEILAQLRHPNVATVFDFGATVAGQHYFVMEFVHGTSLTAFCDREKLDLRRRLELFVLVCEAVQYAHSNNIAHRDLKPANILVEFGPSGAPRPVVIDFGLARSMSQRIANRGHDTLTEHMVGTLNYMSPEQILPRGTAIDNLSDVYALGVILYELLTGIAPFDFEKLHRERRVDEIQRIVSDVEPPTPSARLSTIAVANADLAERIARSRRAQIRTLEGALANELQWIPLKALKKDRVERYPTANAMAEDVRRYLRGSPILAAPDSALYRARKFVRRNRAGVAVASTLVVAIGVIAAILVDNRLAAASMEVAREKGRTEAARAEALESRERLLASQRESLLEILATLLRDEQSDAVDSASTERLVATAQLAAELWRRFCDRPAPDTSDVKSRAELESDLLIFGEAALRAARHSRSGRTSQTGGGDEEARVRWLAAAEGARARILTLAPESPAAEFLTISLQRSAIDLLYAEGKYDEVVGRGELILAIAPQAIARQTDPERRHRLEADIGRLRTTMADALWKRNGDSKLKLQTLGEEDPGREMIVGRIRADRSREGELRSVEVERRRLIVEDPARVSAADRHDLMIALERLSSWYSDSSVAFLFTNPADLAIAREREIALDAEYRERYFATKAEDRSDLENAEFAAWSVREADTGLTLAQRDEELDGIAASKKVLQDAVSRDIDLCIELMWRNSGDARNHERLVVLQCRFLHPKFELDPIWTAQVSERIASLVVAPARAAWAERRLPAPLAAAVRTLRLGSMSRSVLITPADDAQAAKLAADACVQEARGVLAELERGARPSRRLAEAIEVEIQLASKIGVEHAVEGAGTLPDDLKALTAKPR
jgi:serine/threonine protein kinase